METIRVIVSDPPIPGGLFLTPPRKKGLSRPVIRIETAFHSWYDKRVVREGHGLWGAVERLQLKGPLTENIRKARQMAYRNRTTMGGDRSVFTTTHWSVFLDARTIDQSHQREILGHLITKYWRPVYCYLRRKGHSDDVAKDLTQGFFHEVVLGKNFFQQADPRRGRFRTLLLVALRNYVVSIHRAETRRKRHPGGDCVSLDEFDDHCLPPQVREREPHEVFNYIWASELLDTVLEDVHRDCVRDGKETHWRLFWERVLQPIINNADQPSLQELCKRFSIEDEKTASNMLITVKRRFRMALSRHIREHVGSEEEVDEELREMMAALTGGSLALDSRSA
jgi:DNA-directed RNA polymerase specialized sigma24 family protein